MTLYKGSRSIIRMCSKSTFSAIVLLIITMFPFVKAIRESKNVRLVDGGTPYEGRVEIYHGNQWLPVLYYSPGAHMYDWSLVSADVVCKELGHPGAILHGKDDNALMNADRRRIYVSCASSEQSFGDCTYNIGNYPILHAPHRGAAATAKCYYDDYVGCYEDGIFSLDPYRSCEIMTIQLCLKYCRGNNEDQYEYVGLRAGEECYCLTNEQYDCLGPVSTLCRSPCSGDESQICGGDLTFGVYRITMGACGGQFHESGTIYSHGFPGNYPVDTHCTWSITANIGFILKLTFIIDEIDWKNDKVDFFEKHDENCRHLDIKNNKIVSCSDFVRFTFASSESSGEKPGRKFALTFQEDNADCQAPPGLENDAFQHDGDCPYFDGDTISITCKEGYTLVSQHSKIECRENGRWNDTLPECRVQTEQSTLIIGTSPSSTTVQPEPSTPVTGTDISTKTVPNEQSTLIIGTSPSSKTVQPEQPTPVSGTDISTKTVPTEQSTLISGTSPSSKTGGTLPRTGSIGAGAIVGIVITVVIVILVAGFLAVFMYRRSVAKRKFATADTTFTLERTPRARDNDLEPVRYESTPVRYADLVSGQGHRHIDDDTGEMINHANGSVEQHGMVDNIAYESAGQDRYDNEYTVIDHVKVNNCNGMVDNIAYESAISSSNDGITAANISPNGDFACRK